MIGVRMLWRCFGEIGMCNMTGEYQNVDGICEIMDVMIMI